MRIFLIALFALVMAGCGGGNLSAPDYTGKRYSSLSEVTTAVSELPATYFGNHTSKEVVADSTWYIQTAGGVWAKKIKAVSRGGSANPYPWLVAHEVGLGNGRFVTVGGTNAEAPSISTATVNGIAVDTLVSPEIGKQYRFIWAADAAEGKLLVWAIEREPTRGGFTTHLLVLD